MKKLIIAMVATLCFTAGSLQADLIRLYNFEFDDNPSFVANVANYYEIQMMVDVAFSNASIIDYSISNFNVYENGVNLGADGFTGGTFTQVVGGGGTLLADFSFDGSGSGVTSSGVLSYSLSSGDFGDLYSFNGQTNYEFDTNGGGSPEFTGNLTQIPEPGATWLVGLGIAFLIRRRRR